MNVQTFRPKNKLPFYGDEWLFFHDSMCLLTEEEQLAWTIQNHLPLISDEEFTIINGFKKALTYQTIALHALNTAIHNRPDLKQKFLDKKILVDITAKPKQSSQTMFQ